GRAGRALLALGAELVEVRGPVGTARGVRGAAAVPATDAGDRLVAVLVLVDHVAQGLGLAGARGGPGKRKRTTVHMGSWDGSALGRGHWDWGPTVCLICPFPAS